MKWWAQQDLNLRPSDYESPALTTELWAHQTSISPALDSQASFFNRGTTVPSSNGPLSGAQTGKKPYIRRRRK